MFLLKKNDSNSNTSYTAVRKIDNSKIQDRNNKMQLPIDNKSNGAKRSGMERDAFDDAIRKCFYNIKGKR